MTTLHAVVPPRLARPQDYRGPIRRFLGVLARVLPSITTVRESYRRQALDFRRLANAQKDLVLARAYYDAAAVFDGLAKNA
jgi:hypothetical protein